MLAHPSFRLVLTDGPRFVGAPQSSSIVFLVDTHMSQLPYPPDRVDSIYISRPSEEKQLGLSPEALLIVGPRFVGSPKVKSAFALPPPPRIMTATIPNTTNLIL
jgi:hypothetical protein